MPKTVTKIQASTEHGLNACSASLIDLYSSHSYVLKEEWKMKMG